MNRSGNDDADDDLCGHCTRAHIVPWSQRSVLHVFTVETRNLVSSRSAKALKSTKSFASRGWTDWSWR